MGPTLISQKYYYLNAVVNRRRKPALSNAVFYIVGQVDWDRLERAFNIAIQMHDALRTTYDLSQGQICDTVHEVGECHLMQVESSDIQDFLRNHNEPFDLKTPPLMRIYSVQLPSIRCLVLQLPHINSDGWSVEKIMEHACEYYRMNTLAFRKVSQFQSYKQAYNRYFDSKIFVKDKTFWGNKTELTSEIPETKEKTFTPSYSNIKLPDFQFSRLVKFCTDTNSSFFQVMIFASLVLLFTLRRQARYQLMFSVHNRAFDFISPNENFEETVGLMVNRLILSESIEPDDRINDRFQQCKLNLLQILKHHKYPFECFVESVTQGQRKAITPYYFNFFDYNEFFSLGEDASIRRENIYKNEEGLPLSVEISKIGKSIRIYIASNGTYSHEMCQTLSARFTDLISCISDNQNIKIGDFAEPVLEAKLSIE